MRVNIHTHTHPCTHTHIHTMHAHSGPSRLWCVALRHYPSLCGCCMHLALEVGRGQQFEWCTPTLSAGALKDPSPCGGSMPACSLLCHTAACSLLCHTAACSLLCHTAAGVQVRGHRRARTRV